MNVPRDLVALPTITGCCGQARCMRTSSNSLRLTLVKPAVADCALCVNAPHRLPYLFAIATVSQGAPMAVRRDETARLQRNLYIKDRERRKIERQHWRIRLLALAFITVSTAATVALVWVLIE